LSHAYIKYFTSKVLEDFVVLRDVNLSFIPLDEVSSVGFHFLPSLTAIDLTGSPVNSFPRDIFTSLTRLETVQAENYRLCCADILPSHLDQRFCSAPQDEISSCDDLLRSELYRVLSWVICVLSVTGNVFCLALRFLHRNATKTAFNLFVSSLGVADLLMSVYMAIVGAANAAFRGQYLVHEQTWVSSAACSAAGFLSLLSSEVSAFTILLITLDRLIVLRFPFTTVRFNKTSTGLVSMATWVMGVTLAAVPLLPATSHWQFYRQTGTCIPLPVTRREFKGQGYSLGILIFLNFILFVFIAAGQGFIYCSVWQTDVIKDTTRKSRDQTVARRLITVALTDFLCWFPIGLCGILAWTGTAIPGEVSVAMAMLVLPLNAALNPFLYTLNMVVEKRRKVREEKMLSKLMASFQDSS
jgi:hypothetical protein